MSLQFRDISHRYDNAIRGKGEGKNAWHLNELSLTVEPGEIVTLFGPSGCGKTTLLRLAAGLERLQHGEIVLNEIRLAGPRDHKPPEARPVGFVFQDHVLFPHLTVLENIMFGLKHLPKSSARAVVEERLATLQLGGFEKRYPHELSGGQQQRVALARSLARQPKAMLLDEPLASIDAGLRRTLQEEMRRVLKADKVATLFVTHDAEEALMMGDRVALLNDGQLLELSTPQKLYEKPSSAQGAMLFSGSQKITALLDGETLKTRFGVCSIPPHLVSDTAKMSTGQSVELVITPQAISIEVGAGGSSKVIDSRFSGPHWVHFLGSGEVSNNVGDGLVRVHSKQEIAIGTSVRTALKTEEIKFIEGRI